MNHVLIVEDREADRKLLRMRLERDGYRVTAARDGLEALVAARSDRPDAIVSDVLMPKMDGFALCRAWMLDAELRTIPFIFYSATLARAEDEQFAMRLGAVRYLIKPLEAEAFLRELRTVLQEWAGHAASASAAPLDDITAHALHKSALAQAIQDKIAQLEAANRELQESEARFRSIIETAHDAFILVGAHGELLDTNSATSGLSGYSREQLLKKTLRDLEAVETDEEITRSIAEVVAAGHGRFEGTWRHKDGRLLNIEISTTYMGKDRGGYFFAFIHNITERKRAEAELRRLNWALRALGQSNSALVHAGTEKELFQTCCDAIANTEVYPLAWIGLAIDDPAHSIEVAAVAGESIGYAQGFARSWADTPNGSGPTGTAIRIGVTQVTNNLAESAAYLPWIERARAHGLASSISLPIRTDGAAMGALVIYSRELDAFGPPEVELFEELAADIGYGIASRRTLTAYETGLVQREQATHQLRAAFESLIAVLAATVERRDPYTAGHQRRVAELSSAIAHALGLEPARIEGLHFAATIHDIGKIYVPAEILARPGKLQTIEFEMIKSHAQVGFEIVKDVEFPWQVADMIRQHHERLDGSGYPQGLKGDQILLESRILAVADTVEAMSSHRPYRPGLGLDTALAEIRQEAGTKLDLQVVDACERVFRERGFAFSKA